MANQTKTSALKLKTAIVMRNKISNAANKKET